MVRIKFSIQSIIYLLSGPVGICNLARVEISPAICNFQREVPESEFTKLRKQLEDDNQINLGLESGENEKFMIEVGPRLTRYVWEKDFLCASSATRTLWPIHIIKGLTIWAFDSSHFIEVFVYYLHPLFLQLFFAF